MKLPFKSAAQVESERFQSELRTVDINRRNAYIKEADPLFFEWKRGDATEQQWLDKIEEIKQRFPKPD